MHLSYVVFHVYVRLLFDQSRKAMLAGSSKMGGDFQNQAMGVDTIVMLIQGHLTLQLARLKRAETWSPNPCGLLSFIFPSGGLGQYVSQAESMRLNPGDVLLLNERNSGVIGTFGAGEFIFWTFSLSIEHLFPLFAQSEIPLLQRVVADLKPAKLCPSSNALAAECHRLIRAVPPRFNLDHRGQLLHVAASILNEEFSVSGGMKVV